MTRRFVSGLMIGLFPAASALGVELNLSIRSPDCNGTSEVSAAPGETVDFAVCGVLTDTLNEGLALFAFDLVFDGGPLDPETVLAPELLAPTFMVPGGITNPDGRDAENFLDFTCPPNCGFSGTLIDGRLAQVGGGQNTIVNVAGNAPFPVADPILIGLGHTETTLATGSLTAPASATAGVGQSFTLSIPPDSVFANVIQQGQTGDPFWATEQADVGTIVNLTINGGVVLVDTVPTCSETNGSNNGTWWRSANNFALFTFSGDITAPAAGQVQIRQLQAAGAFGADVSGDFTFTVENDGDGNPRILRIQENGDSANINHRTWYGMTNNGWPGVADFQVNYVVQVGDVNGDGQVLSGDISFINEGNPCFSCPDDRRDINGDDRILSGDVSFVNDRNPSFRVNIPDGHTCIFGPIP